MPNEIFNEKSNDTIGAAANDHSIGDAGAGCRDVHGQTAMLLVESLIHGLVAESVINVQSAMQIVEVASDTKIEIGTDLGDTPAGVSKSVSLLAAISASLSVDLPGRAVQPKPRLHMEDEEQ